MYDEAQTVYPEEWLLQVKVNARETHVTVIAKLIPMFSASDHNSIDFEELIDFDDYCVHYKFQKLFYESSEKQTIK